ncbi:MAG: hypothetical protein V7L22_16575 [Nostoc sp.]|uniref:hypothetical protein n=1 Tax=Nostoc sp. TaxID=1180 RepID=UPI002FF81956
MSLAGIERRLQQKPGLKKAISPRWNPINSFFLLVSLIILGISSFLIASYILSLVSSIVSSSVISPTSIPWIENKSDCQNTNRTWQDNKCWDYEHSLMF